MQPCAVTTDLNRHLDGLDREDSRSECVETRLDELMEDGAEVRGALDAMMGESDLGSDGNSLFAGDLAAVLLASDDAFGGEAIRYFVKLRESVRAQLRGDAETLVDEDHAQSEQAAAEARYEAQHADIIPDYY